MGIQREIMWVVKGASSGEDGSIVIDIPTAAALRVFGPRVYDVLRKDWIDDDIEVVWLRDITPQQGQALRPYIADAGFAFDFAAFDYSFTTWAVE